MDLDLQTLDHDELLGVESLEDIIDVENEMGFGEGEDWSHDDGTIGYGKLAASRKRGLFNKASAIHGRPRTKSVTIHSHRSHKPLTAIQHGHKHGIPTSPQSEEKSQTTMLVSSGVEHAFGPGNDVAKKLKIKNEVKDETNDMLQTSESEEDNARSLHSSHDEEDMHGFCMGLDARVERVSAVVASKHGCAKEEMNVENAVKSDELATDKERTHMEARKTLAKREEKASCSNRVRFSLDVETAEKVTGYANRRSTDAKEKSKCSKQQEWRYVRSTPSDSHGFGNSKAPIVAPVKSTSAQRKKEASTSESTKDASLGFDLEKAIEIRDEKKAARLALERVERFEDAMLKQQEIVANIKLSLANEGTKDYAKLRQLVDALDRNIKKVTVSSKPRQVPQSYELKNRAEQINRLKAQCNLLETDRERLKKKLRHFLENANGKEKEQEVPKKDGQPEGLLNERENLLEQKVKDLERALADWETKFKKIESDFAMEQALLEDNLSVCKLDWRNKQQRWLSKMKERETELSNMKASQDNLVDSLMSCRQCMDKLRREAISYRREVAPHGAGTEFQEEDAAPKNIEETNALDLADSIQSDIENLRRLLAESSILQDKPSLPPEVLRQENKVLENKVAQTIALMTEVKQEMKAKEVQINKENEKYAGLVAEKVKHIEALKEQLTDKEQGMEGFLQELKDKVSYLSKELECERGEKSRLSEQQGNLKYKLMKGLRKKEQKLEEEIEGMKERLEEMKTTVAQRDERLASLEDEVKEKCAQLAQEKQKWNVAIKEVKQKAAKTILRFMHGKENGLLEYLRERKKGHKAGEGQAGLSCKTDDDEDDADDDDADDCKSKVTWMHRDGLSKKIIREKLQSKRQQARIFSGGLDNPRDSHHLFSTRNFDNIADFRSSFDSNKEKASHDFDLSRKDDLCLQETYPKVLKLARRNRFMERRDF
ncbi:hypothetical protein L7F22_007144 [Adiantum nelumboides]|nr:hypothetical protein [Adiantum nelumboides]